MEKEKPKISKIEIIYDKMYITFVHKDNRHEVKSFDYTKEIDFIDRNHITRYIIRE